MAAQVQITSITKILGQLRVAFNLILSGNYVAGGDTVDFTKAIKDPAFQGAADTIETSQAPIQLDIWSQGGNLANGFFPVLGATLATSKVKIVSAFNTELGAGAYGAGLTGDKICGEAVFNTPLL